MRTLLVTGRDPAPDGLRELVRRGSTSVDEVSAAELSTFVSREGFGVDRLVFWVGRADHDVRSLALNYATAERHERQQRIVFVTPDPGEPTVDGMTREEIFVWPRDEEKLKIIFLTGG
jgi:hypothetical protein